MTSTVHISNLTQQWMDALQRWHLDLFVIPPVVVTLATLMVSSVLLMCVLLSPALRQETRYLLVANTLAADVLFLVVNLTTVLCNTVRAPVPWLACELLTAVTVTAYSCAILTITLMVVDTYAAVRWPLRYHDILPPARTHGILLGLWVGAAVYPFTLVILMERSNPHDTVPLCLVLVSLGFIQIRNVMWIHIYFFVAAFACALLIFYCYVRLYMVTKTQGIWQSRFSRARVTLRAHGLMLLLYFVPGFVFSLELSMFHREDINRDVLVWISTVNMCVFMMLPRALAPYLYGLRYREISDSVIHLLLREKRPSQVTDGPQPEHST